MKQVKSGLYQIKLKEVAKEKIGKLEFLDSVNLFVSENRFAKES